MNGPTIASAYLVAVKRDLSLDVSYFPIAVWSTVGNHIGPHLREQPTLNLALAILQQNKRWLKEHTAPDWQMAFVRNVVCTCDTLVYPCNPCWW